MSETETRDADRRPVRLVQVDAETLRQLRSDKARYKSDRDDAWARCAAEECECVESVNAENVRLRGVVEAVQALADEFDEHSDRLYDEARTADGSAAVVLRSKSGTYSVNAERLRDLLAPVSSSGEVGENDRLRAEVVALRSALVAIRSFHGNSVDPDECMTCEAERMPCRTARAADAALAHGSSSGEAESGEASGAELLRRREWLAALPKEEPFVRSDGRVGWRLAASAPVPSGGQADGEGDCLRASEHHLMTRCGSCGYQPPLAARPVLSREALAARMTRHWPTSGGCACGRTRDRLPRSVADEQTWWWHHLADVLAGGEQR